MAETGSLAPALPVAGVGAPPVPSPRERARELAAAMQCNCDLDNWEPEPVTGHSHVCRIHKAVMAEGRSR